MEVAQQHMDKFVNFRQQWAGCYTHGLATYGCRSTLRCEGLHGSVRTCSSANMTLTDCCCNLELFVEQKHINNYVAERKVTGNWLQTGQSNLLLAFNVPIPTPP